MISPSALILNSSREYALYVCQDRAIPYVGDGLKHVQRMALWLLRNRAEKIKTIALGGLLSYEKIYVHGDVSATNAIGLLAAPYNNNVPLIEGHGSFGNRLYPTEIGAPRYTEVRRAKIAEELLYHDLDIVPLEDNYDGSNKQPKHFLPLIPTVLLNGVSGIAVGWSTNILPRDLKALIEATKAAISGEDIKPIPPSYRKYDCAITEIGPNRWEIFGKVQIMDNGKTAHITELPPGIPIETFRKRLIEMENNEQIRSFIDRSTESIDITVRLKTHSGLEAITLMSEKDAVEFFKLRERVTERIVVIDWNGSSIRTYDNAADVVRDFVQWRLGWYTKRFEHLIQRDSYELNYWIALQILFKENFTNLLGSFSNRAAMQAQVSEMLKDRLVLDDAQMDRVVGLATYRWTKEFESEVDRKILDLQNALKDYESILQSPKKLRNIYLKELDAIKVKMT